MGHDDGPQLLPGLGQVVFDAVGLAGGLGRDHPGFLQLPQALGQQGGRHRGTPRRRSLKRVEPASISRSISGVHRVHITSAAIATGQN